MSAVDPQPGFEALGLAEPVSRAVRELGYETPSPIQHQCIPHILQGHDLIGQAQTGTGKTAAFALPILSRLSTASRSTQLLVLTPTRELAIQVAEALQSYARNLRDFHVLPIYGGQGYDTQLRQLRRGVQAVVGTPGRVMDHIRRGTLRLDGLTHLVLDEADEMLRMGFIDDVEWILEQTPDTRQIALFSATMPAAVRKVAERHLREPKQIRIAAATTTAPNIRQRFWRVSGLQKLEALTRILEVENFEAMLVFVRTKIATEELAGKLAARGYACEALNGDIAQKLRERTVEKLRNGGLDILVATDVAARGLDVDRISHVVNYDIPYDTEAYVHRVGRTGRAGRSGEAILFVAPREMHLLKAIERATRQPIESMPVPSTAEINQQRILRFKQQITDALGNPDLAIYQELVGEFQQEHGVDPLQVAAALASMLQRSEPLLLKQEKPPREHAEKPEWSEKPRHAGKSIRPPVAERASSRAPQDRQGKPPPSARAIPLKDFPELELERFRLQVGYVHGVQPGNIVGAIANEAELDSCYIGHIEIHEHYSTVDLPADMPKDVLHILKKARVCGQKLGLEPYRPGATEPPAAPTRRETPAAAEERTEPATLKMKRKPGTKPGAKAKGKPAKHKPSPQARLRINARTKAGR